MSYRKNKKDVLTDEKKLEKSASEEFINEKNTNPNGNKRIKTIAISIGTVLFVIVVVLSIVGIIYSMSTEAFLNRYFKKEFKKNGYSDLKIKVYGEVNVDYQEYNKLTINALTVKKDNKKATRVGIALSNSKKNMATGVTIDMTLNHLLNGLYLLNKKDTLKKATEICAKYIEQYGMSVFANKDDSNFKRLLDEIASIEGIKVSREGIEKSFKQETSAYTGVYYLLYDKNSAFIRYICTYDEQLAFNDKYPMDEKTYKYIASSYSNRQAINTMQYVYGDPYTYQKVYTVYSNTGEFISTYKSLSTLKSELNVELYDETGSTSTSSNKYSTNYTSGTNTQNTINSTVEDTNTTNNSTNQSASSNNGYSSGYNSSYNYRNSSNGYNYNYNDNEGSYNYEDNNESNGNQNEVDENAYKNWKMFLDIKTGLVFEYNGEYCLTTQVVNNTKCKYMSYTKDPRTEDVFYAQGYHLYFNGEKTTSHQYEYKDGEDLTVKIVAPYIVDIETGEVVEEDVVLYEKVYPAKETYQKSAPYGSARYVSFDVPTYWDLH